MVVKTPFERHQKSKTSSSGTLITILVVLIVGLGAASIYLSRDRLMSDLGIFSTSSSVNTVQDGIISSIGSSITIAGVIMSSDSTAYTHILTTTEGQVIGLKSSMIDLSIYGGTIVLDGIVQTPYNQIPIIDIMTVVSGTPIVSQTSSETGEIVSSGDVNVTKDIGTGVKTTSTGDDIAGESPLVIIPILTTTTDNMIVEPSVSQFRINTGKTLIFKANRGFTIIFPTQNIAYKANNINTGLEFGKNIVCNVETNMIIYSNKDNVDETPSAQIYECTLAKGFATKNISGYRIIAGNTDRKVFLLRPNDPTWTRFINNTIITYEDVISGSLSIQ